MKRSVAAIAMPDIAPGKPETAPPVFINVRPEELLIDISYQRDLSDASLRLIKKIVAGWDWRKFKAPNVAMTDEGPVVLDGQHTSIAAACHPAIDEIPVLMVDAPEQRAQAEAFVGMNTTRLAVTAAQIHAANVAAGEPTALAIDRTCSAAGIKLLRLPASAAAYKPRESIAVAAIASLVARRGEERAVAALRILASAEYGPVQANHVRAIDHLLSDPEFEELDPENLARTIQALGLLAAEKEARVFASTHCVPTWRGLAATWFKNTRKTKRKPAIEAVTELTSAGSRSPTAGIKSDARPAFMGWKPGSLTRRCPNCNETFTGDLTASMCGDCAYGRRCTGEIGAT